MDAPPMAVAMADRVSPQPHICGGGGSASHVMTCSPDETLFDVFTRLRARRPIHTIKEEDDSEDEGGGGCFAITESDVAHLAVGANPGDRVEANRWTANMCARLTTPSDEHRGERGYALVVDVDGTFDEHAIVCDDEARRRITIVRCYSNAVALATLTAVAYSTDNQDALDDPAAGVFGTSGARLVVVFGAGALRASERALSAMPERAARTLATNGEECDRSLALGTAASASIASAAALAAQKRQCAVVVLWSTEQVPATEVQDTGAAIDWIGRL